MKLAIVGFGVEGRALAAYFLRKGDEVTIFDREEKKDIPGQCKAYLGPGYLKNLKEFDLVFRSPGIPFLKKEFDPMREKLTSLTKYFFEKCPCPIVGVTGTKGKGTTATLIYEMVREGYEKQGMGRKVFLGGNIGEPPLNFLDELTPKDLVILEVSSFQLQDLDKSPHIAVVLGITPDHLDHHCDIEEYIAAKKNIVSFQKKNDFAVLDFDSPEAAGFKAKTKAHVFFASIEHIVPDGGFLKVSSLVLKKGKTGAIFGEKGEVGLIGPHNLKNLLAAATVAHILTVPIEIITKVARDFKGLPHRLQLIREIEGIRFYDDSASTNPETTIAALRSFHEPTILILGGSSKNLDFEPLGEEIAKRLNIRTVIIMGETKQKLEEVIERACIRQEQKTARTGARIGRPLRRREIPLELITAENFQEAFMVARLTAKPGDVVLFSPGCASFDMFKNYKERGEIFTRFITDAL